METGNKANHLPARPATHLLLTWAIFTSAQLQSIREPLGQQLEAAQAGNGFKHQGHFLGKAHVLFHWAWHEPTATPTGLENNRHGLSPDRPGNSSQSAMLLAPPSHGFHQGLQFPERFPHTSPSKGRRCQTSAADALAQHWADITARRC